MPVFDELLWPIVTLRPLARIVRADLRVTQGLAPMLEIFMASHEATICNGMHTRRSIVA